METSSELKNLKKKNPFCHRTNLIWFQSPSIQSSYHACSNYVLFILRYTLKYVILPCHGPSKMSKIAILTAFENVSFPFFGLNLSSFRHIRLKWFQSPQIEIGPSPHFILQYFCHFKAHPQNQQFLIIFPFQSVQNCHFHH